jgi:hypothetical protein
MFDPVVSEVVAAGGRDAASDHTVCNFNPTTGQGGGEGRNHERPSLAVS